MIFAFSKFKSSKYLQIVPCKPKHNKNQPPSTRKPPIGESYTRRMNTPLFVTSFDARVNSHPSTKTVRNAPAAGRMRKHTDDVIRTATQ